MPYKTEKCVLEGCNNKKDSFGLCSGHGYRLKHYGSPLTTPKEIRKIRFWQKVAVSADTAKCWEWQGGLTSKGYGKASMKIEKQYWRLAHRIAYFLYYNTNPKELHVCHRCDNPKCCNPHHLFLGTALDNLRDMASKNRSLQGERNTQSKLTESQVVEIKQKLKTETVSALARAYSVTFMAIQYIKQGKTWKHLNK